MTEPPLSLAYFDREHDLHGAARAGATLLFDRGEAVALAEGPEVARTDSGYRAALEGRFELSFTPLSEPAALGGASARVCRVTGTVAGVKVSCLGTATETREPPAWEELDAVRAVSAIFAPDHAVLALARRPRGAPGHGKELVMAGFLSGGEMLAVDDARISTVYDGDGRHRSAGLELWIPGEDFPRRASGVAVTGTTLELGDVQVNFALFRWHMEGREGTGAYDLTFRPEAPAAA